MLDKEQLKEMDNKYGQKVVDAYVLNAENKESRKKVGNRYKIAGDDRASLEGYARDLNKAVANMSDLTARLRKIVEDHN